MGSPPGNTAPQALEKFGLFCELGRSCGFASLACDFGVHLGFPAIVFLAGSFLVPGTRLNFLRRRRTPAARRGPALLQCAAKSASVLAWRM